MRRTIKLFLPALFPSWNFFDYIAPSPQVEYRVAEKGRKTEWQTYRPRPDHVTFMTMIKRLFWNPSWNESLYIMSCAERLMADEKDQCCQEIAKFIQDDLQKDSMHTKNKDRFQFRLVSVFREGGSLQTQEVYVSPLYSLQKVESAA